MPQNSPGFRPRGVVLVTGASRGIGAATASALAADGFAVAVNYSSDAVAAQTVTEAILTAGGQARAFKADVSAEAEVTALFNAIDRDFGPVTGLVNNAGISGGISRVDEVQAPVLEKVFAINVIGAFLCAREAVRRMSTRHGGHGGVIVNVSSRAADLGGAGEWVHYAASKGALDTFTIGLAREVAKEGIRVNAVSPGLIETEFHAAAGRPGRTRELASAVPMGRPGSAEEVATTIAWLMSPATSYLTGTILPVSGGR